MTPSTLPKGTETILLVEDDDLVRDYAVTVLDSLGYAVIAATDGQSALQKIRDVNGQIDLLFTDIVMPGGLNGHDLAKSIIRQYPRVKVLYTSGYNESIFTQTGALESGLSLLEKPYRKADLAHKIRALLDDEIALGS